MQVNGKTYERINGKFQKVGEITSFPFNGKTYKKIFDGPVSDPKEACINKCVFCERDENGEPCCGAPNEKFWGCNAGFHWEEI